MASKARTALILVGIGIGYGLLLAGEFGPTFALAGLALLLAVSIVALSKPYHRSPPADPTDISGERRLPRD